MDVKKDIIYINGSTDPKHTLDVYTQERSIGCIVWFHGGGLSSGQKNGDETLHVMQMLSGLGFSVANAAYRLYPGVSFPGQVQDAAAATAHVRKALPDILMMAGDNDNPGRWDQQVLLGRRLRDAGYENHRTIQIPDRDHSGIIRRMGEPGDPVIDEISKFLTRLAGKTSIPSPPSQRKTNW